MASLLEETDRHSPSANLAWRVITLVNLFRLLIPLLLIALLLTISPSPVGQTQPAMFVGALTAYFLFALGMIPSIKARWPQIGLQTSISIGVDVLVLTLITYASGGMNSGLAALLVLPIGAASFVVRQRLGLSFAAVAALALLLQQVMTSLAGHGDSTDFAAAGIVGALMFIVTFGVAPLADSLRESEERVRQREVDVANLAELNQFIVQHLRESILVVDENDTIRLINESAAQMLKGGDVAAGTPLGEVAPRLLYLLETWRLHSYDWQLSTLSLLSSDGGAVVQPHFVSLDSTKGGRPTLIFLEDTTIISERVQQSKLASLGRLSASIAHEIRNPVGAMSHAAQLLAEATSLTPQERRLTSIIATNGERVSTIINNVLQLSRRDSTRPERIEVNRWINEFLGEFRQTAQIDERTLQFEARGDLDVRVDPSHLHQMLWNLCENALKYGRKNGAAEPIEIRTGRMQGSVRPYLEVLDRGPGIPGPDAERIFEPFFTSGQNQGGTGLGLFIARELAQCNRAILVYEPRSGGGSIFRVVFADPQRWEAS